LIIASDLYNGWTCNRGAPGAIGRTGEIKSQSRGTAQGNEQIDAARCAASQARARTSTAVEQEAPNASLGQEYRKNEVRTPADRRADCRGIGDDGAADQLITWATDAPLYNGWTREHAHRVQFGAQVQGCPKAVAWNCEGNEQVDAARCAVSQGSARTSTAVEQGAPNASLGQGCRKITSGHLQTGVLIVAGLGMTVPLITRATDAPRSDAEPLDLNPTTELVSLLGPLV
jgi:hypothetical protein